jgi:hypothetical protein
MAVAMRGGRSVLNLTLSPILKVRPLIQSRVAGTPDYRDNFVIVQAAIATTTSQGAAYETGESGWLFGRRRGGDRIAWCTARATLATI